MLKHLQKIAHSIGYWLQCKDAKLVSTWQGDRDVREAVDDADVGDGLDVVVAVVGNWEGAAVGVLDVSG